MDTLETLHEIKRKDWLVICNDVLAGKDIKEGVFATYNVSVRRYGEQMSIRVIHQTTQEQQIMLIKADGNFELRDHEPKLMTPEQMISAASYLREINPTKKPLSKFKKRLIGIIEKF